MHMWPLLFFEVGTGTNRFFQTLAHNKGDPSWTAVWVKKMNIYKEEGQVT